MKVRREGERIQGRRNRRGEGWTEGERCGQLEEARRRDEI